MPQMRLPHAMIADIEVGEDGSRTVVLNCNEEYLFQMLDSVNPKNIVKYLDMRGVQHRSPTEINLYCNNEVAARRNTRKYKRIIAENERLKELINGNS